MKTLQFTVPVEPNKTVIVQEELLHNFYPHFHQHKEAQLVWIIKGEGTLIAESSMHPFKDNDIFMIEANQPHVFKNTVRHDENGRVKEVHTISVFFDPSGNLSSLFRLPELNLFENFFHEYKGGFKVPSHYFEAVSLRMVQLKDAEHMDQLMHFFYLLRCLSTMKPKPQPLSETSNVRLTEGDGLRMGSIYNYIMHHHQSTLTLEDVAEKASLTPPAFCRYFKKHTGVTFVNFLNKMRVNEACKKLASGQYDSISTVAYTCGFNSITNFNRVFKSVAGTSPKTYLNNYMNTVQ